jgi:hypothetical protein
MEWNLANWAARGQFHGFQNARTAKFEDVNNLVFIFQ